LITIATFQDEAEASESPSHTGEVKTATLMTPQTIGAKGLLALVSPSTTGEKRAVALVSPHNEAAALVSSHEEFPPDKNGEEADIGSGTGESTPPSRPSSTPLRYFLPFQGLAKNGVHNRQQLSIILNYNKHILHTKSFRVKKKHK
jgi:hypothetical protein